MTLISIEHSPVDEIEPTAKKVLDTMRDTVWDKFGLDEKVTRVDRIPLVRGGLFSFVHGVDKSTKLQIKSKLHLKQVSYIRGK